MRGLNRRQLTDYSDDLAALMKWTALIVLLALAVAFCGRANAGTVALTSDGKNPATLTWSTAPTASSCSAADGWSGTKAVAGSEKLVAVTATTKYTLNCTWAADDKATLTWTAPASNTDGSTPATVDGYDIYQDDSATPAATTAKKIAGDAATGGAIPATQLTFTVTGLAAGVHNFALRAWQCQSSPCGVSDLTPFVSKTNTAASTAAASVSVSPAAGTPKPPSTVTLTATTAYDLTKLADSFTMISIGTLPAGAAYVADRYAFLGTNNYCVVKKPANWKANNGTRPATVFVRC